MKCSVKAKEKAPNQIIKFIEKVRLHDMEADTVMVCMGLA